jgi:hypothetical protein
MFLPQLQIDKEKVLALSEECPQYLSWLTIDLILSFHVQIDKPFERYLNKVTQLFAHFVGQADEPVVLNLELL